MEISKYRLESKLNKRVVLISDIHYYNKSVVPVLKLVFEKIKDLEPDYICITGDLVDDINIVDTKYLVDWIKSLSKISSVIISVGNHEHYYNHKLTKMYDYKLFNKFNEIDNVYVLSNKIKLIDNINFVGINLPYQYYNSNEKEKYLVEFMNKKYPKLRKGFNILLCHSPYVITNPSVLDKLKCKDNISLILSGHMHAGLTFKCLKKVLKGRGFITPQGKVLKKYCYGIYKYKNITSIISTGVTKLSKNYKIGIFNFLYEPEIVVIDM